MPGSELPQEYYDAVYTQALHTGQGAARPWFEQASRACVWYPALLMAEGPVADLGCGPGHLSAMCRTFGLEYAFGLDISPKAIELATKRYPRVPFYVGSVLYPHCLLRAFSWRTIMLLEVLEHVRHDLAVLWTLPPGAHVVASVPSFITAGHVRAFSHRDEVRARYGHILRIKRLVVEKAQQGQNRWFIFSGVRR